MFLQSLNSIPLLSNGILVLFILMDEHLVLTQQKLIIGGELSDLLQVGLCLIQPKLISLRVKLGANVVSQLLELAQAKLFLLPIQL